MRVRVRLGGAVLGLTAVVGFAAACGGSSSTSNAANSQPGFQAYAACLRQNGVTLPQNGASDGSRRTDRSPGAFPSGQPSARPSGGAGRGFGFGNQPPAGVDQATWDKAVAACSALRPTGGPGGGPSGGPGGFGNNSAFAAYRNCLADHGVSASADPRQLNSADPTTAQAMKVCAPLRPSARPRPSASA